MKVGTKSVLFGAHCWFIHPWFVALAWWHLYGFPTDPRLWVAFFVHDVGYWGCPNMDGPEGEDHDFTGAGIMGRLFDPRFPTLPESQTWFGRWCDRRFGVCPYAANWFSFSFYHSRFMAKRYAAPYSKLCPADKLAVALEPWWLYLPRVVATGEIDEYMAIAGGREGSKYNGEPKLTPAAQLTGMTPRRGWHRRMTNYLRQWAYAHRDGDADTWTPNPKQAGTL